jgi:hypothetical protein
MKLGRYIWYAIGEILLIFAGITLALWFSNWNDERKLRESELQILADIAENLRTNVDHFRTNIKDDEDIVSQCNRFVESTAAKQPWSDELGSDLYQCRWWTSPFLTSAAYQSLKAKGTDLIADKELRSSITKLYEQTYAFLVNDIDKGFWGFQESIIMPLFNRHIRNAGPNQFVPNDYQAMLESTEFFNMLHSKIAYQTSSIENQRESLVATEEVIDMIEARLAQ